MIGIVGKKCGMTRVFTDDGRSVPVTIVQAHPNFINRIKTKDTDGYNAIQVLAGSKVKQLSKPDQGQINKTNKEFKSKVSTVILSLLICLNKSVLPIISLIDLKPSLDKISLASLAIKEKRLTTFSGEPSNFFLSSGF